MPCVPPGPGRRAPPWLRTGSGYGWMRVYQVPWPVTLSLYDDGWPSPGPSGPERHPDRWHLRSGDRDRHRAIPARQWLGRGRHRRASSLGCPRRRRRAAADADADAERVCAVPAWAGGRDFRHLMAARRLEASSVPFGRSPMSDPTSVAQIDLTPIPGRRISASTANGVRSSFTFSWSTGSRTDVCGR